MSEPQSQPVTPDLPPPVDTPDLDAGAEEVVRQHTGTGADPSEAAGTGDTGATTPLGQDVNPDAGAVEPTD